MSTTHIIPGLCRCRLQSFWRTHADSCYILGIGHINPMPRLIICTMEVRVRNLVVSTTYVWTWKEINSFIYDQVHEFCRHSYSTNTHTQMYFTSVFHFQVCVNLSTLAIHSNASKFLLIYMENFRLSSSNLSTISFSH